MHAQRKQAVTALVPKRQRKLLYKEQRADSACKLLPYLPILPAEILWAESMQANRRVLHVDDDRMTLRMVHHRLNTFDIETIPCESSQEVLDRLIETDCRTILLDIDMPSPDGLELLRLIKQHDGGLQVVMLSGLVRQNVVLESMRRGAEAFFFKPLEDYAPLAGALEACFENQRHWWEALAELKRRKVSELASA